ncbi:lysophospholipid acyltransferase, partial [Quaeritorhiza haematococci]
MIWVMKISSFAWAVYDGTRPDEDLFEDQKTKAIRKIPSLLEFLAFVFFFGGWLVGPNIEYAHYHLFMNGLPPFDRAPSQAVPTLKALGLGLVCMGIYLTFGKTWDHNRVITDPSYDSRPLWWKFLFIQIAGAVARNKYYGAWKIAEGACVLTGIGYAGKDSQGNHHWDRVSNVKVLKLEFSSSPRDLIGSWNIQTALWLRNCIYLRLTPKGGKPSPYAQVATFLGSAVWHGFRPSYYLTFMTGAQLGLVGRLLRRNLRPLVTPPSKLSKGSTGII